MDSPFLLNCLNDLDSDLEPQSFSNLLPSPTWPSHEKTPQLKRPRETPDSYHQADWERSGAGSNLAKCAKNKASREKARRERINERFAELARLCDGEEPKVDKSSILMGAIKCVKQQRMENQQLKQLNKFLEERVTQYEKERSEFFCHQELHVQTPMRTETVASGIPLHGNFGFPLAPQKAPNCAISERTSGHSMGVGTAVGVPAGGQKFSLFQASSPAAPGALWVQDNILDTSHDHLLRPPAA